LELCLELLTSFEHPRELGAILQRRCLCRRYQQLQLALARCCTSGGVGDAVHV
jgi:hypothetical protein